jgi:hypothetical protein
LVESDQDRFFKTAGSGAADIHAGGPPGLHSPWASAIDTCGLAPVTNMRHVLSGGTIRIHPGRVKTICVVLNRHHNACPSR